MSENSTLQLQIHYELFKEGYHKMDAKIYNECERQFLKTLDILKNYIGDFEVEVVPKEDGGIIETLIVSICSVIGYSVIENLIKALIQEHFSSKSKKTKLEEIKDRLDIQEKIKKGNLSEEDAIQLVEGDKPLMKNVSKYYKSLDQESKVISVSGTAKKIIDNRPFIEAKIIKADFKSKIIEDNTEEDMKEDVGTTINILSPVLQSGHGTTWKGFHSGETIDFRVKDKEFLQQVYNNDIKFGSSTVITCTLITHIKHVAGLEETEEDKYSYIVKDVTQWADGNTFKTFKKRYRKSHKVRQLDLFSDSEDNTNE
jgi:hypothetical protein